MHVVAVDVLIQGTSERHVDQLLAAADAEHGQPSAHRRAHQGDLGLVECWIHLRRRLQGHLTVGGRVDIPTSGQQETVDAAHHRCCLVGLQSIRSRFDDDGLATRSLHRAKIRPVVRLAAQRTAGDSDPGLGHLSLLAHLSARRWLAWFVLAAGAVIAGRMVGLAASPPGLYNDEASIGYNAWIEDTNGNAIDERPYRWR